MRPGDGGSAKGTLLRWREFGTPSWRKVATVAASVLALGLGYHVMFGQNGLTAYEQKREESRALDEQMQRLQRENELLKGHVGALESDPDAIEHQARETMHYTRSGEVIYGFPEASRGFPDASRGFPDASRGKNVQLQR